MKSFAGSEKWLVRAGDERVFFLHWRRIPRSVRISEDFFEYIDSVGERVVRVRVGRGGADPAAWQVAKCE